MKFIEFHNCLNYTIQTMFLLLAMSSCSRQTSLYCLYVGELYPETSDILLHMSDSSYNYTYKDYDYSSWYTEIGKYYISKDTLVLIPKKWFDDGNSCDTCTYSARYQTMRNGVPYIIETPKRYYYVTPAKNAINDITLEYYCPRDSNTISFLEHSPMEKVKISRFKKEKQYEKQNRSVDERGNALDVIEEFRSGKRKVVIR